jgi:hypothetical protein
MAAVVRCDRCKVIMTEKFTELTRKPGITGVATTIDLCSNCDVSFVTWYSAGSPEAMKREQERIGPHGVID